MYNDNTGIVLLGLLLVAMLLVALVGNAHWLQRHRPVSVEAPPVVVPRPYYPPYRPYPPHW